MSTPPSAELERHIGRRLRAARKEKGWSMELLGEAIAVSYQQVSRFEKGEHRISAGQLYTLAAYLHRPVSWFFQSYQNTQDGLINPSSVVGEQQAQYYSETNTELSQRLNNVLSSMTTQQRRSLADFLESL